MYRKNKLAFTLVELIVVISILAILGTIAFISMQGYSGSANNSKILYDVKSLTSLMEIKLSEGGKIDDYVLTNRKLINGVNSGSTVSGGAYTLTGLSYEVGTFDFAKFGVNGTDFVYDDGGVKRDYIFAYVKTPEKLFYEFAGQIKNVSGDYNALIKGNYLKVGGGDTAGIISENGLDVGLINNSSILNSLY